MIKIDKNAPIKIDKKVPLESLIGRYRYAFAAEGFEKGDSAFFKTKAEARCMEQALRNRYRWLKYGTIVRHSNQTVKRVTRLRRQKDSSGEVVGFRVWLMVDYPEDKRQVG